MPFRGLVLRCNERSNLSPFDAATLHSITLACKTATVSRIGTKNDAGVRRGILRRLLCSAVMLQTERLGSTLANNVHETFLQPATGAASWEMVLGKLLKTADACQHEAMAQVIPVLLKSNQYKRALR